MGSQRDQTADDTVQKGLMYSSKEGGAATEGFWPKLWTRKIRFVHFLAVSLILLIVIIVLTAALASRGDKKIPMCSSPTPPTDSGDKKIPMCSSPTPPTDSDCYSELRKQLCGDIEDPAGCSVCPDGWLQHNKSCYYIYPGTEYKAWSESRKTCKRMGANLTIIEDLAEKTFIERSSKADDNIWIGVYRDGDGWRGVDGQSYNTSQLQKSVKILGDCMKLHAGVGYSSVDCQSENSWICEKKALNIGQLHHNVLTHRSLTHNIK